MTALAKWLEDDRICMRIRVVNAATGQQIFADHAGGLLDFLPDDLAQTRRIRLLVEHRGDSPDDDRLREQGANRALIHALIDPLEVMETLMNDAQHGEVPFLQYCEELNLDDDSMEAYRDWQRCWEVANAMRTLLGMEFDVIQALVLDYSPD